MSEITEIPKCNCDSHNNSVCDVCQIYIPEIERLNEEVKELKKSWYEMHSSFEAERTVSDRYRMAWEQAKRDAAMASTALDVIDRLTAELARYKQGVEVEVTVDSYDYGDTSFICEDIKLPSEFRGQRVRVLVMKEEG